MDLHMLYIIYTYINCIICKYRKRESEERERERERRRERERGRERESEHLDLLLQRGTLRLLGLPLLHYPEVGGCPRLEASFLRHLQFGCYHVESILGS